MQESKISLTLSNSYIGISLSLMYLVFMSFGNLFRFLHLPLFRDNILVSEAFLYFFAFFYLITIKINKGFLQILLFSVVILTSTAYGSFLHAHDLRGLLFALRLVCTLFSAYALGDMFWKRYGYNLQKFLRFFLFPFVVWIFFGFIIYFAFPSLNYFWKLLNKYNIIFCGDPHIKRYVTVIFDPNMYGAIVFIPILTSFLLYCMSRKIKYLLLANLFFVTALLTWSRSGIATVGMIFAGVFMRAVLNKRFFNANKALVLNFICVFLLLCLVPIMFYKEFSFFYSRIFDVLNDGSALYRLRSFQLGLSILQEHPLFGIGFNYVPTFLNGLNFLDSSLLGLLVCFGIVPFTILAFIASVKIFFLQKKLYVLNSLDFFTYEFCAIFLSYILVVVFFSSAFNNILLFPFWIIPTLSCLIYIGKMIQHQIQYSIFKDTRDEISSST